MRTVTSSNGVLAWVVVVMRYHFSIYQKRIFIAICEALQSVINRDNDGKLLPPVVSENLFGDKHIEIPISMCLKNEGDENYKQVIKAFYEIENVKVESHINGIGMNIRPIHLARHIEKTGILSFVIDVNMVKIMLTYIKGCRFVNFNLQKSFDSLYTMRLYELIASGNVDLTFNIATLRRIFCLENKYKKNNDFIRNTIAVAKTELDAKSPVSFTYSFEKDKRHFDKIRIVRCNIPANDPKRSEQDEFKKLIQRKDLESNWLLKCMRNDLGFTDDEIKPYRKLMAYADTHFVGVKITEIISKARSLDWMTSPKAGFIQYLRDICGKHYHQAHDQSKE